MSVSQRHSVRFVMPDCSTSQNLMFLFFLKVESTGELELNLHSIMEWGDRWLVTFNSTEMKLLSFNRHRDPFLVPVEMNGIKLPEETSFRFPWLDRYSICGLEEAI